MSFITYKALAEFNFGPLAGITIAKDEKMDFDGTTLKLRGASHPCPVFSIAVRNKFVVPVSDMTSAFKSNANSVEVKSATSQGDRRESVQMGLAVEDELVVGSVSGTKDRRVEAQSGQTAKTAGQAAPARTAPPAAVPTPAPPADAAGQPLSLEEATSRNAATIAAALAQPFKKGIIGGTLQSSVDKAPSTGRTVGGGKYKVEMADGASQGVVIGTVKSGRNSASVGVEGEATRKARADLTKVTTNTVEWGLLPQRVTEGIRGLDAKSSAVPQGIQNAQAFTASGERTIVANPPKKMAAMEVLHESEDIRSVVGGVTGDARVAAGAEELRDLLPDALVAEPPARGARAMPKPQESDPAEEIKEILAEWSMKRHWQKRVTEAVEMYGEWPEFLEALYEIEVASVVKHIKSRLEKRQAEG